MEIKYLKKLSFGGIKISGRNNLGKITSFHRGGAMKAKKLHINFNRFLWNQPAIIRYIKKDFYRTSYIMLICYDCGILSYILAPENVKTSSYVYFGEYYGNLSGYSTYLMDIPVGTFIYNIEKSPGSLGSLVRAAGTFAQILKKSMFFKKMLFVLIKLPSGELKYLHGGCKATIGVVSNSSWKYKKLQKAGDSRKYGRLPVVRGVAMNPIDHPHGGGEGKSSGGRPSVTPWGVLTKGFKTKKKNISKYIFKRRKSLL